MPTRAMHGSHNNTGTSVKLKNAYCFEFKMSHARTAVNCRTAQQCKSAFEIEKRDDIDANEMKCANALGHGLVAYTSPCMSLTFESCSHAGKDVHGILLELCPPDLRLVPNTGIQYVRCSKAEHGHRGVCHLREDQAELDLFLPER